MKAKRVNPSKTTIKSLLIGLTLVAGVLAVFSPPYTRMMRITAMVKAVESGSLQELKERLESFDVNTRIHKGSHLSRNSSLLIVAAQQSNFDMVKCLLDHGADPGIQNNGGYAAIHYAAQNSWKSITQLQNDVEILKLLVQYRDTLRLETKYHHATPLALSGYSDSPTNFQMHQLIQQKIELLRENDHMTITYPGVSSQQICPDPT